jgi:hypothetical protein
MYAVKAIYDGVNFKPKQPILTKGKHEVLIIFSEPVTEYAINTAQAIKRPRSEIIGCLKGKVWMADDFNAPIEELKEYME